MKTAEELLQEKKDKIISCPPDTSIRNAIKIMEEKNVGSIFIMENGKALGIWTERDLLHNVSQNGFDLDTSVVGDYMVSKLHYARSVDSAYVLMDKFLGLRFRHILVEKNEHYIGVLSIGDVLKYSLREKFEELKQKNAEMSWEYYEEWKWPHKNTENKK